MNPRVSVLIASRDYGQYLGDTLRSVQAQTFTDWEMILVDDGSRDDTPQVVRPFLDDPRIRCIRTDTLGQARAKSLALRLSRAPLIAYLDGDDLWLPSKLERQVRLMDSEPGIGVVFTRRFLINSVGEILPFVVPEFPRGMVFDQILLNNFVCFSSTMVRREALEHVGAFSPALDLAIDYDLWLRMANHYSFDFIDEPLVKYRTGHGNLSKRIAERIMIVFSTMRRCLHRRGKAESTSAAVNREAWGSTCRTMAFVQRDRDPLQAARWYARAATYDGHWLASFKGWMRLFFRARSAAREQR